MSNTAREAAEAGLELLLRGEWERLREARAVEDRADALLAAVMDSATAANIKEASEALLESETIALEHAAVYDEIVRLIDVADVSEKMPEASAEYSTLAEWRRQHALKTRESMQILEEYPDEDGGGTG